MRFLKYFKKTIVVTLMVSFVLTPYFGVYEKAEAQVNSGSTQDGGYSTGTYGGAGISGYIKGLAPAIVQLPGCKKKIQSGIKNLFKKSGASNQVIGSSIASGALSLGSSILSGGEKGLSGASAAAEALVNSIPVSNPELEKKIDDLKDDSKQIKESTASLDENENCLKSVGQMVIKLLLQKITLSTVAWIQSGFDGNPAFIQNPGNFFRDIAKNEILQFSIEIKDPSLYPFGKNFLQQQAAAFNNKFADNAKYSLNELIQSTTPEYSAITFNQNFEYGGWDAWTYMTQVPANNPLGFQIMASNELSQRLEGTQKSVATEIRESLTQAAGYLGDNRCANPVGVTKEENDEYLRSRGESGRLCKQWEYVTPGKMVAETATKIVNYPDNNLLKADDLNAAVTALIDALLARFSSDLMQKGFADFSNQGSNGAFIMNYAEATGNGAYSQTERDFPETMLNSNWLKENPDFNIRTDLTQAMIDEQRIFITKLEEQNEAIDHIIKTIRQLDYCIPGPNPDWETTSSVDEFYRSVKTSPRQQMPLLASMILSFDPTGIFSGVANAMFEKKEEEDNKKRIAKQLQEIFDIHIFGGLAHDSGEQDQVLDEGGMRSLVENTFESYRSLIYKIYFAGSRSIAPMPEVTAEARAQFDDIRGYEQMVQSNLDEIPLRRGITTRLAQIKEAIDNLNSQYGGGPGVAPDPESSAYTNALKDWIYYFGRISRELVTGNDIARVDDILKEIKKTDDYVYDVLLKGPGGCETELESLYQSDPLTYSKFIRRQPYPLPIYYFYGNPASVDSGNNTPPQQNAPATKYFGSSASWAGSASGGTWVGDNNSGTWWTGSSGNGIMLISGLSGSGVWSSNGISGTWTGAVSGVQNGQQVSGSWSGSSGSGAYTGSCSLGNCNGTWSGGNGSGISGGGYAPHSGIWYGTGGGIQTTQVSGPWTTGVGGSGFWNGTVITVNGNTFAIGTWSGGGGPNGSNTGIGQWLPGNSPTTNNPPTTQSCADGPCSTIPWNEDAIAGWDPNQGFLYGAIYYNRWTGPLLNGTWTGTPPKITFNIGDVCEEFLTEFHGVELSLPGGNKNPDGPIEDIGGFEITGTTPYSYNPNPLDVLLGIADPPLPPSLQTPAGSYKNNCGIITRQFEKIFNIY